MSGKIDVFRTAVNNLNADKSIIINSSSLF